MNPQIKFVNVATLPILGNSNDELGLLPRYHCHISLCSYTQLMISCVSVHLNLTNIVIVLEIFKKSPFI